MLQIYYTTTSFRSLWSIVESRCVKDGEQNPSIGGGMRPQVSRVIDFNVTPHLLRHTYATRLFERGLKMTEVQHLLGHESPDITMRIYVHYCASQDQIATFEKHGKRCLIKDRVLHTHQVLLYHTCTT